MAFELLNPVGLERPVGYAHVAKISSGKIIYVAGQAPFAADGSVVGKGNFVEQFRQVVLNLKTAVEGAGGRPDQFAVLTMYVTDVEAYLANAYRNVFGKHFPAITMVEVSKLYHPDCMVEISGVAVVD
ncbi:MAG: RidA family protein [Deltaproteobacteria bacterium]|nr:RidA family protein [Deltaproteobacteria bacterium]